MGLVGLQSHSFELVFGFPIHVATGSGRHNGACPRYAKANPLNPPNQPTATCVASVAARGQNADTASVDPIAGWILGW
jgi:hypothetical protein